jgi:hypothetical protein
MSNFPGPDKSVFWHSFESLTEDGKWRDEGPNGLHATPQAGYVSPNYGLAKNITGKGYAVFTGAANVYATLSTRFYSYAPTTSMTLILVAQHFPVLSSRIFNARTGTEGIYVYLNTTETLNIVSYDAGGVLSQFMDTISVPFTNRTQTSIYVMQKSIGVCNIWHDRQQRLTGFTGSTDPIKYNTTIVPSIGSAGAASYFVGRMYLFALFPFAFTDSEAKAMTDYLRDLV